MPIEIRELVIRATVDQAERRNARIISPQQGGSSNAEKDRINELIKLVKEKNER